MKKQNAGYRQLKYSNYIKEINRPVREVFDQLYKTNEFKDYSNLSQQLGRLGTTPAFKNISAVSQQLGRLSTTPAFENISAVSQQLGGLTNSPALRNINKMTQKIRDSLFSASAVSTMQNIININHSVKTLSMSIATTPAYRSMILDLQECIGKNSVLNDNMSAIINKNQKFLDEIQDSELLLEELIEHPDEEIKSKDIDEILDGNTLYELYTELKNTIDSNAVILKNEAIKNKETRKNINELEKDNKKLITKKQVIFHLIILLISPIFLPFQEAYNEWISQPGTHLIKYIKKEIKSEYVEKEAYVNIRIVKRDNLKVKRSSRVDSETLYTLNFGNLVELIDKKRNWARIRITNYDSEVIEGWVFTRYLEKIN